MAGLVLEAMPLAPSYPAHHTATQMTYGFTSKEPSTFGKAPRAIIHRPLSLACHVPQDMES